MNLVLYKIKTKCILCFTTLRLDVYWDWLYIVLYNIKTEIILYCREYNGPVIVASPDGGVDIEEVAEKTPERIMKVPVDIKIGTGLTIISYLFGSIVVNLSCKNSHYYTVEEEQF